MAEGTRPSFHPARTVAWAAWRARLIAALARETADVDAAIDEAVRGSPVWRQSEDLLRSKPRVVARTLLAEPPELGALDRRRIAALCGRAPWPRQFFQWRGKSFIGGGRSGVCAAVFMAVVIARKLLVVLNAVLRIATKWDEARHV